LCARGGSTLTRGRSSRAPPPFASVACRAPRLVRREDVARNSVPPSGRASHRDGPPAATSSDRAEPFKIPQALSIG
jgi:hypothetical protein